MKRLAFILLGAAVAGLARSIASGAPVPPLVCGTALVLGAALGAIATLGHLGGREDLRDRVGTVAVLFLGGVAAMGSPEGARAFVPCFSIGALAGAVGLVVALGGAGEGGQ